jgi:hypothetical protein
MHRADQAEQITAFEVDVLRIVRQLESVWTGGDRGTGQGFSATNRERAVEETLEQAYRDASRPAQQLASDDELRSAAGEAKTALEHTATRSALCRVLQSATEQSQNVAQLLIPACLPLALTGQIPVSATPLVWGLVCFAIGRIGVSVFCGGQTNRCR